MSETGDEQLAGDQEAEKKQISFEEMDFAGQKEAIENALEYLSDDRIRQDLENRDEAVSANGILNEAVKAEMKRREALGSVKIEVNIAKQAAEVAEITNTDFFKDLQEKSAKFRRPKTKVEEAGEGIVAANSVIDNAQAPYGTPLKLEEKNQLENSLDYRSKAVESYLGFLRLQTAPTEKLVITGEGGVSVEEMKISAAKTADELLTDDFMNRVREMKKARVG